MVTCRHFIFHLSGTEKKLYGIQDWVRVPCKSGVVVHSVIPGRWSQRVPKPSGKQKHGLWVFRIEKITEFNKVLQIFYAELKSREKISYFVFLRTNIRKFGKQIKVTKCQAISLLRMPSLRGSGPHHFCNQGNDMDTSELGSK